MWKTKCIAMNQKLKANEINQSMKDTESVESRAKNILAEWNYVPTSIEAMKKLALVLLTRLGPTYSCKALLSHVNFI